MKILGLLKNVLTLPFKPGLYLVLILGGICVGVYRPALKEYTKDAALWLKGSANANFDPDILTRPEKELDLIQSVNDKVQPRVKKAQILIRKQQAEIAYMREQCELLQMKVNRDKDDPRPAEQILSELAEAVQKGTLSAEQRKLYDSVGQTWIALHNRIQVSQQSLQGLSTLETRINFLQGKLDERRLSTLRYVPERIPSGDSKAVVIGDIEQAENLLQGAHETLFKTVVSLSPEVLKDTPALVTANYTK